MGLRDLGATPRFHRRGADQGLCLFSFSGDFDSLFFQSFFSALLDEFVDDLGFDFRFHHGIGGHFNDNLLRIFLGG